MELRVNVFKYKIVGENYIKNSPISNIYITVRDKDGRCESKQTGQDGSITFNLTNGLEYTVYETLENINSDNLPESFFDNLVVKQPVIDNSDTDPSKEVTSTTPRKYKITAGTGGKNPIEFGHSVYKSMRCHNKGYLVIVPNGSKITKLQEIDIPSGKFNTVQTYNNLELNALAYNYKEKALYGMVYARYIPNYSKLYRINGEGDIVKFDEIIDSSTNTKWTEKRMSIGDCDKNGLYYVATGVIGSSYDCYRINLNPNSLNYLYLYQMDFSMINGNENAYNMADWKYSNDTNKLYSFVNNSNKQDLNIIEISVDLTSNTLKGVLLPTDTTQVKDNPNQDFNYIMIACYGYDNGPLYFMGAHGNIYKADIMNKDKSGNYVMEWTGRLNKVYDNPLNADGANCSEAPYRFDFGNAPESDIFQTASYKTSLAKNGPRHAVSSYIHIGEIIYPENDAIISEGADDNDGVEGQLPILDRNTTKYYLNVKCYNNTGYPAKLYGWLDFNTDGVFSVNEFAYADVQSTDGYQIVNLEFNRPIGSVSNLDKTFIRLRLTTEELEIGIEKGNTEDPRSLTGTSCNNKISFTAIDGEVEDWMVNIDDVPYIVCKKTADKDILNGNIVSSGEVITYTIVVNNYGSLTADNVVVKDDLDVLDEYVGFVSAKYVDDAGTEYIGITKDQLKNGVNVGSIAKDKEVIFTIKVKVI